jgi:molybdenum cofactor cytidylyltransferase
VRVARIDADDGARPDLAGAVLARDLRVGGERWAKGRRLSAADLGALATDPAAIPAGGLTVLVPEPGDLHEDAAALRLATAVGGPGLTVRGPAESRVDLLAAADGVLHVLIAGVERLNRLDPLELFTALDGSIVSAGQLVASVKVAPHLVAEAVVAAGEAVARGRARPLVRVAPFLPRRVGVLVKESLRAADRERFETSVRAKVEGLGSRLERLEYVVDESGAVAAAVRSMALGRGAVDVLLTAGGRSTDPSDPFFTAIEAAGGRLIRRGVPAHPGSMLWLARVRRTAILGLPTCGAYSKATAADLLLPRLLTGEPPTAATVARLGHGGILTRDQRFRFPLYARELDSPEG